MFKTSQFLNSFEEIIVSELQIKQHESPFIIKDLMDDTCFSFSFHFICNINNAQKDGLGNLPVSVYSAN